MLWSDRNEGPNRGKDFVRGHDEIYDFSKQPKKKSKTELKMIKRAEAEKKLEASYMDMSTKLLNRDVKKALEPESAQEAFSAVDFSEKKGMLRWKGGTTPVYSFTASLSRNPRESEKLWPYLKGSGAV